MELERINMRDESYQASVNPQVWKTVLSDQPNRTPFRGRAAVDR